MKTLIIPFIIIVLFDSSISAQKVEANKVPAPVMATFLSKFSHATDTKWEMEKTGEYEATFKLDGQEVSANFDNSGNWIETETEIKIASLPPAVQATLKKDFSDYKIKEASKVNSVKKGEYYEAEIQKGGETFDAMFTADGKFLEKIKVEEEKNDKD